MSEEKLLTADEQIAENARVWREQQANKLTEKVVDLIQNGEVIGTSQVVEEPSVTEVVEIPLGSGAETSEKTFTRAELESRAEAAGFDKSSVDQFFAPVFIQAGQP
jgi:hypothetical protein